MSAIETFENFVKSLPLGEKEKLSLLSKSQREELFAARSEEARVRIAHDFIVQVHEHVKKK